MALHPGLPPDYIDSIITGDARELAQAIPDESIDLIFTDPIYEQAADYAWLAELGARVLRPDRALLAYCGMGYLPATLMAITPHLNYKWLLSVFYANRKQYHGRLQVSTTVCIWADKGKTKLQAPVGDSTTVNHQRPIRLLQSSGASWDKHPQIGKRYLLAFTQPGWVVLDPFAGLGSTAAACKLLGRHHISFEIEPDRAARARQRVISTQAPLPLIMPEQASLL